MDALYHKVADKWKMIGVLIEIPKGTLAAIAESSVAVSGEFVPFSLAEDHAM